MSVPHTSTYNEDHIVGLVSEIYTTLIHFGHFEEHEIVWPTAQGHTLDLSKLDVTSRIDERVVSLMKRLPLPNRATYKPLAIRMKPTCFTDAEELAWSRDIDKINIYVPEGESCYLDMSNALPTEFLILQGEQSDDPCLVLDVADNTIRYFNPCRSDLLSTDGDPSNHRNWPAVDAVEYLTSILMKFKDALWIPSCDGNIWTDDFSTSWIAEVRRRLIQDYGWPNAFRRADWQRDAGDMIEELIG